MKDISAVRADFPILSQHVNGKPLVYFDNGATSQKPQAVLDAIAKYYSEINSNVHRGVHKLSQLSTDAYEAARIKVQQHINAAHSHEVIYTSGTTQGINLVANCFSKFVAPGDQIIISTIEHHSNIVPWQMLCERTGAELKVIPIDDDGALKMDAFEKMLSPRTKLVAVNHISNALGTINPVHDIITKAHGVGAAVLIDGAQAVPHMKPDVHALDCDFYVFSAHKMCGPTGTGILYGKESWLNRLPPYQGGGEMIREVSFEKTTYADLPYKFEAGTPNIEGSIGLGAAIDYLNTVGFETIHTQESALLEYATQQLSAIDGLKIYGNIDRKVSVVSFNIEGIHPYDIGAILDKMGVAVRTGHHCAQPVMSFLGVPGTVRASMAFYNTKEEVDVLVQGVKKAKQMLS